MFRKKKPTINQQDITIKYLASLNESQRELIDLAVDHYQDYLATVASLNESLTETLFVTYEVNETKKGKKK